MRSTVLQQGGCPAGNGTSGPPPQDRQQQTPPGASRVMLEKKSTFVVYALGCIALNLALTFSLTHGDQISYADWTGHLQRHGFADFPGNYPPLYVEWLWVVGQLFELLGLPPKAGIAHKFFMLWPIYAAHLLLVRLIWNELKESRVAPPTTTAILALSAFNPALLAGGPAWGQVDLFPAMLMAAGFYLCLKKRGGWAAPTLWVLALLTKFQMIAFAPVIGALVLRDVRRYGRGLLLAGMIALLVLLPFILAGGLAHALSNAYLHTTNLYPYATLNAANLWLLLVGNSTPDSQALLASAAAAGGGLQFLGTPKGLGMLLFALYCLGIFIAAFRIRDRATLWKYVLFCALAFFVLLPGMHERYLLPAVVMALFWAATAPGAFPWALVITVAAFFNIQLVHGVQGDAMWWLLALVITGGFVLLNLFSFFPRGWAIFMENAATRSRFTWLPEASLALVLIVGATVLAHHANSDEFRPNGQERLIQSLTRLSATQSYKAPLIDRSVDGNVLSVNNVTYNHGIGTHAPSRLEYALPPGARGFRFKVGVDDEAYLGKVEFLVQVDGQTLWRSGAMTGGRGALPGEVYFNNAQRIALLTDPLEQDFYDHANWLNPVILME
ncbi:MAG: NPCBM/NEW2 domain-containing protein [Pseudomonadota bacterium]